MLDYLKNRSSLFYNILIFSMFPVVILVNIILNTFVGGLLLIAAVIAAAYLSRLNLLLFLLIEILLFPIFAFSLNMSSKQVLIQGSIFYLCLILALITGREIARFIHKINEQKEETCKLTTDLIFAFVHAIDAKDDYLHNHSSNVSHYAKLIARELNYPPLEVEKIALAGLFHDIGKINVDSRILNKKAKLSADEWEIMKKHVMSGVEFIKNIHQFEFIYSLIKYHHRHYDGGGYPDDCPNEDVPFESRILSVADSFDAMTSDRPYRQALSLEETHKELRKYSGSQFDPKVIEAFFSCHIEPVCITVNNVDIYKIVKAMKEEM